VPLFFFRLRDERGIIHDVGQLELSGLRAAAREVSVTLGEMAKDQLRSSDDMELAIEVHNEQNELVLIATVRFDIKTSGTVFY
jgi:hypothetical protein